MLHKTQKIGIVFLIIFISGCYSYKNKTVTLIPKEGPPYTGEVVYKSGYSGIITIKHGPDNEKFTGEFVVIDRTATAQQKGTVMIPLKGQIPAMGTAEGVASGAIDAFSIWLAVGNRGSRMECKLQIGRGGHGHGLCKHSDGNEYEIML
jgi:hypothetical protein